MELAGVRQGLALVLKPRGRLDVTTADEFERRVLALVHGGDRQVVIDCSDLRYVSAAGLRALLRVSRSLTRAGGRLTLHSLPPTIQRQFIVTGFSTMFRIYGDADEAVQALAVTGLLPSMS